MNPQILDTLGRMLPALFDLGRSLLEKHKGDERAARSELQDMVDHGKRYVDEHDRIQAKIDARVEAEKKP